MNALFPTTTVSSEPTLFLVGIDDRLTQLLASMRIRIESFPAPETFLEQVDQDRMGCVFCDVAFGTGFTGFQLLTAVKERHLDLPVVLVSGAADMSLALRAVSEGALTLLSASCDAQLAAEALNNGLTLNRDRRLIGLARRRVHMLISRLSEREAHVMRLITEGLANKQIAAELNVSLRSVEKWRKDGLEKLEIESPLQLLRMLMQAGFQDWPV
jgi:two-component system response regulator FixJ